jgi:hypothetical protein
MQRATLMRHSATDLAPRLGIPGRPIGGDTPPRQVARVEGRFHSTQKRPDVVVRGIVVSDLREDALRAAIIDRGEQAERPVIECIGGHLPRKIRQGPVQEVRGHARRRLFLNDPSKG